MDRPKCSVHNLMADGLGRAEAMDAIRAKQAQLLDKYGWYSHLVDGDDESPTGFNAHSHGMNETYCHHDFQIVIPLPKEVVSGILFTLAEAVKAGRMFAPGDVASEIINGFDVTFAVAIECGREVLRVILPGPDGRLARDEIDASFAPQYIGTIDQ